MKRSAVFSLSGKNSLGFILHNKFLFIMCFLFLIGLSIGTFTYSLGENFKAISSDNFEYFLSCREGKTFWRVFFNTSLSSSVFLLALFFSGTSLFGVVLVPFLNVALGFYFGNLSAFLYSEYAFKGVAFNALLILPFALLFSLCIFFSAKFSFEFSLQLLKLTFPKSNQVNINNFFKAFCSKYLLCFLAIQFCSFISALLSASFLKFFEL